MRELVTKFVNLVFENACLICNKSSGNLEICQNCREDFKERKDNHTKYLNNLTVYSFGYYDGKLRHGIINLKNGKKKLALYFSNLLIDFWQRLKPNTKNNTWAIIPVPSHKKRIEERGYCQTSSIAKDFAKNMSFKYSNDLLIRKKNTKHMNNLKNINERIENIKDAFILNKEISNILVPSSNLLIIDDIVTSGSTMCEIAKTIHKFNPEIKLHGLTIASGDLWDS